MTSSPESGKQLFKRLCAECHNIDQGEPHKYGPSLYGLNGQMAGGKPNYNYSKEMKTSGIVWTEKTLFDFLDDPRGKIPGCKHNMPVDRDVKNTTKRDQLVKFVMSSEHQPPAASDNQ